MSLRKTKRTNKNKGFSIIEVAVATGIVATALVTMLSLFAYNMHIEILNRNKIVASYLAQEAMEVIKQKRDTNWFSAADSSSWMSGIPSGNDMVLSIEDKDDLTRGWDISPASSVHARNVYVSNGTYVQSVSEDGSASGWADTGFTRTISIDNSVADRVRITVRVGYNDDRNAVVVSSYLYNDWFVK